MLPAMDIRNGCMPEVTKQVMWLYSVSTTSRMPNALDIYCLSGNVAEWTNDGNEIRKRVRGGSYHSEEEEVTVTFTESASPDMGSMYIGMRLLLIK